MTIAIYLAAVCAAELTAMFLSVPLSLLWHAVLVLFLLSQFVINESRADRRLLPVLALASILRILSFTIPIRQVPQIYWYAMIGIPFLIAIILTMRLLDISWGTFSQRPHSWSPQLLIALSGIPLSFVAFSILHPKPLLNSYKWIDVVVAVTILSLFVGFVEEIYFRGLLLRIASELSSRLGLLVSSILFAVMYLGSLSWAYVLFIGLVGLFFGWCVRQTRSIWGVVLAHSIFVVGAMIVWPLLQP